MSKVKATLFAQGKETHIEGDSVLGVGAQILTAQLEGYKKQYEARGEPVPEEILRKLEQYKTWK